MRGEERIIVRSVKNKKTAHVVRVILSFAIFFYNSIDQSVVFLFFGLCVHPQELVERRSRGKPGGKEPCEKRAQNFFHYHLLGVVC